MYFQKQSFYFIFDMTPTLFVRKYKNRLDPKNGNGFQNFLLLTKFS